MAYLTAHTATRTIVIPEVRIERGNPVIASCSFVPLRGYAHVMACFVGDACIGWIDALDLGYTSVKAWMLATDYIDEEG